MKDRIDCRQFDRELDEHLGETTWTLSDEGRGHVAVCRRCAALCEAMEGQEPFRLPQRTLDRLHKSLPSTLKPVRPLAPNWVFLVILAAIFVVLVLLGAYRLGLSGWEVLTAFQKLVIFTSLLASAGLLAFTAVSQMAPASRNRMPPAMVPIAAFVMLVIVMAGVFQYERDPHFVQLGMRCMITGIPYAIPAAILFFLVLRRGVSLRPVLSGATSGMLAGLIGTSVLEVHCPILDAWHVLVWHLGVCCLGALLGLLAGYLGSSMKRLTNWI